MLTNVLERLRMLSATGERALLALVGVEASSSGLPSSVKAYVKKSLSYVRNEHKSRHYLWPKLIKSLIGKFKIISKLSNPPQQPFPLRQFLRRLLSAIQIAVKALHIVLQPSHKFITSKTVGVFADEWEPHCAEG